jgi:hypothetical protein
MSEQPKKTFPKLHNAMWPGLVGKGSPGAEPCIDLDTMLELTANAEVDGVRFDGVDLFLFDPHIGIDLDDDGIKRLAEKITARGFVIGSVVAPVWAPTGGGSAMGNEQERAQFLGQVLKACRIGQRLRQLGARPYGVVRIDSACGVADWAQQASANQQKVADTFRAACDVAKDFGERLAAEGEICWGGMHSWRNMVDLLERVGRPETLGFQADMAHTLLYLLGYNAPEDALLPPDWDWADPARLDEAMQALTNALRPWTIDFHVAQNDGTVKGSGTHDKTGHHCLPNDPNGKLRIAHHAGFWLRKGGGAPTRALRHICWDGCMFPNAVMSQPDTWNDILRAMIAVREAHGWNDPAAAPLPVAGEPLELSTAPAKQPVKKKPVARRQRPLARSRRRMTVKAKSKAKAPKAKPPGKPTLRKAKRIRNLKVRNAKPVRRSKARGKRPAARKSTKRKR